MNIPSSLGLLLVLLVLGGLLPSTSYGGVIDLPAVDAGFVTNGGADPAVAGGSSKFDALLAPVAKYNYSVGWEDHYGGGGLKPTAALTKNEKRNYFAFDLSGISDPITSATLKLPLPLGGYDSPDATETFIIGGNAGPFMDPVSSAMVDAFAALMTLSSPATVPSTIPPGVPSPSGPFDIDPAYIALAAILFDVLSESIGLGVPEFGMVDVTSLGEGGIVTVDLTTEGIDYLNLHLGGGVVLGGRLSALSKGSDTEEIFSFTGPDLDAATAPSDAPILTLTTVTSGSIPVPGTSLLIAAGLLLLGSTIRGSKKGNTRTLESSRPKNKSVPFSYPTISFIPTSRVTTSNTRLMR